MNALVSLSTGLLLTEHHDDGVIESVTPEYCPNESYDALTLSALRDWHMLSATKLDAVKANARKLVLEERAISLLECAAQVTSPQLRSRTLEEVESLFAEKVDASAVSSGLLLMPLSDPSVFKGLAALAISTGHFICGTILDSVASLQPQLRRLYHWWSNSATRSRRTGVDMAELWANLSRTGVLDRVLKATSPQALRATWLTFTQSVGSVSTRKQLIEVLGDLEAILFPGEKTQPAQAFIQDVNDQDFEIGPDVDELLPHDSRRAHQRILAQVSGIADAIGKGNDSKAERFLAELIQEQSGEDDKVYLVKSLCNIARRAASVRRRDFEARLLLAALKVLPEDGYALLQYADHLKRVKRFPEALEHAQRAISQEPVVARSTIADIYAVQGRFETALAAYRLIPGWEGDDKIQLAIADLYRKSGDYERAEELYTRFDPDYDEYHRVKAGLAEIARRRGEYAAAREVYEAILSLSTVDPDSRFIYRGSLADVFVAQGDFGNAYKLADQLVHERPFDMRGRAIHATVLALSQSDAAAIESLKKARYDGGNWEWLGHFTNGLLLLRLGRHQVARSQLLKSAETAIDTGARITSSLGAALAFLSFGDSRQATRLLRHLPKGASALESHIRSILRFHAASCSKDARAVRELREAVDKAAMADPGIEKALGYIIRGDFKRACYVEAGLMLRIAA